ncbi:MAG: hypothetical protein FJ265_16530 [Planctomycetes bacterium]|nr:hypothetical protein [Planctomycetota bacterium]
MARILPVRKLALVWLLVAAVAQPPQDAEQKVAAAAEKWLESDTSSQELLDATVRAMLVEPKTGIRWIGDRLGPALADRKEARHKGLVALATHVALEFLRQQSTCGIVFAGQYSTLAPLQPFVGELFFELLLDTPPWFPDTHRIRLVPALRDLQPQPPAAARIDRVVAVVEDEAIEPEPLRRALACMLWQWGSRQYVLLDLERLQRESAEGDAEDRLRVQRELAELQYQLRDYRASAATHRALQQLAAAAKLPLTPTDWYSAACVHALCGNVERGIEALQKCADAQAAPETDSSYKLERKLLENDPEIAPLRADGRYAAIFARMFPPEQPTGKAHGR